MNSVFGSVIAALVIAGCGSSATPVATNPVQEHTATPPAAPDANVAAREVLLTEKVPVALSNGVTLTLVTVMEAHITDRKGASGNEFRAELELRKGQDSKSVTLTRVTTSSGPTGDRQDVWGTQLSLVMVDAYHQPSTASLLVAP